ncbi:hypothetical protein AAA538_08235 [Pseudomonas aeruginosa]
MIRALVFLVKLPFMLVMAVILAIWQTFILPLTIAKEESEMKLATEKAPSFFRNLRDSNGNLAIDNIHNLSDKEISSTYQHVAKQLRMLALQRREKITDGFVTGVVRDCLIVEAANGFDQGFEYTRGVLDAYTAHGQEAVKVDGRRYG